jgi:hypothetical protein
MGIAALYNVTFLASDIRLVIATNLYDFSWPVPRQIPPPYPLYVDLFPPIGPSKCQSIDMDIKIV